MGTPTKSALLLPPLGLSRLIRFDKHGTGLSDRHVGIAVRIASRVVGLAGTGEVLVSSTVRDLVAGSGLRFQDRGSHLLKGLPEPLRLVAAEA
jgi:class 3 adenylate cyclase